MPQEIRGDDGEVLAVAVNLEEYMTPEQLVYARTTQHLMMEYNAMALAGRPDLYNPNKVRPSSKWLSHVHALVFDHLRKWHELKGEPVPPDVKLARRCPLIARWTQIGLLVGGFPCRVSAGSASWYIKPDAWQDDGASNTHYSYHYDPVAAFRDLVNGDLPEVHCWVEVLPSVCAFGVGQVVDLTANYLKDVMTDTFPEHGVRYERTKQAPDWRRRDRLDPDRYERDMEATKMVHKVLRENMADWTLAVSELRYLAAVAAEAHKHLFPERRI